MPFFVKLNPEFSSYLLEEAKALIALSLVLLPSKKKAYYCVVSEGHQIFDCRMYCGLNRRMQGDVNMIFLLSCFDILMSSPTVGEFVWKCLSQGEKN